MVFKSIDRIRIEQMGKEPPLTVLDALHKIKWTRFNDQEATEVARAVFRGAIDELDARDRAVAELFR